MKDIITFEVIKLTEKAESDPNLLKKYGFDVLDVNGDYIITNSYPEDGDACIKIATCNTVDVVDTNPSLGIGETTSCTPTLLKMYKDGLIDIYNCVFDMELSKPIEFIKLK